jgi:hypothetical protein
MFQIRDWIMFALRVLAIPAYLYGAYWGINRYFEHERAKAIMDANVKMLCIQQHACGDDCKDI